MCTPKQQRKLENSGLDVTAKMQEVAKTANGLRRIVPIEWRTFERPSIKGMVAPGGYDWQTIRPDKVAETGVRYLLKTGHDALVRIANTGLHHGLILMGRLIALSVICHLLFSAGTYAATVDTLEVYSASMQKTFKVAVVLPDKYEKSKKSYPVLYLLHGGQGSFRNWLTQTTDKMLLHKLVDQYNIIIVNPEGGLTSYYFDSPLDKSSRFETFISKEVVEKIDNTYPTIKDRKGRLIAGLSMGGHGAMFIAARHPDLFCAAGSMSGVMDINTKTWKVLPDFAKSRAENFARLLGPPKDTLNPYPEYTIVGMVDKLKANDVKLIFDVGVDDFLIEPNRELHKRLVANGTPHDYIERPGKHEWAYWTNALPYQLLFFQKVLQDNGTIQNK